MTDIVERIKDHLEIEEAGDRWLASDELLEEAAQEIERLGNAVRWEQNRAGRMGTHAPGCWAWGHQHYECALQEIKRLAREPGGVQAGTQTPEVIQPPPEKMLRVEEACAFLGVPRSTFYSNVKARHLPQPYYITQGSPRWKLEELTAAKKGIKK